VAIAILEQARRQRHFDDLLELLIANPGAGE
jgi:hypothetical protein